MIKQRLQYSIYTLMVALILGCGGVPPTYYYRIHYDMSENNSSDPIPIILGIRPFDADAIYKGDRIVYRNSEYEVQFYHYRRWVAPPNKIVQESIAEQFQISGGFQKVVSYPPAVEVDYVLTGNIKSFEEWDDQNSWYGLVSIAFELQDRKTGRIIWQNTLSEKTSVSKKDPVEVVKAISQSLKIVVDKAITEIRQKIQK